MEILTYHKDMGEYFSQDNDWIESTEKMTFPSINGMMSYFKRRGWNKIQTDLQNQNRELMVYFLLSHLKKKRTILTIY